MKIDVHESDEMESLLSQSTDVIRVPLNSMGYADYMWSTWNKGAEHAEHKEVDEILSNMPRVEMQLRKHLTNQPNMTLWLIITSHAEPHPTPGKGTYSYKAEPIQGRYPPLNRYVPNFHYTGMVYERYEGFLNGLARAGVLIRQSPNRLTTAKLLVRMEKSAATEGTTLNRHVKPVVRHHYDPQVQTLLGAHDSGVDVVLAEELIDVYKTVYAIVNTSAESIAYNINGMGLPKAQKLLKSFGVTS